MAKKVKGSKPLALARTQLKASRKVKPVEISNKIAAPINFQEIADRNDAALIENLSKTNPELAKQMSELKEGTRSSVDLTPANNDAIQAALPTEAKATRSPEAKAAMKSGFEKAKAYGSPTKQQCLVVFTPQQYAHSWDWREEKLGVTPELFQELLAKGEKIAVPEKKKISGS